MSEIGSFHFCLDMLVKGTKQAGAQGELWQLPETLGAEPPSLALMAPVEGDWWEGSGSGKGS